jgi:AraC family transcriptional activator of pobA
MQTPVFIILQRNDKEIAEALSLPNEPHNHDWEELIIITDGIVEHFIDFKKEVFEAPIVTFVTRGKMHSINVLPKEGKRNLWGIRFKSEFIPEITFQLYYYFHDYATIPIEKGSCIDRIVTLCEMMKLEMDAEDSDYSVIKHLLSATFIMIEGERRKHLANDSLSLKSINNTFKSFLKLLEENFKKDEGVEFYSEKLFMSSKNLNKICQQVLQQSVSEIIETRKLIEAKNMLISTNKTISEICFEIGYNDKAYFSNVFKKKSGQTPTEFRLEMRKLAF